MPKKASAIPRLDLTAALVASSAQATLIPIRHDATTSDNPPDSATKKAPRKRGIPSAGAKNAYEVQKLLKTLLEGFDALAVPDVGIVSISPGAHKGDVDAEGSSLGSSDEGERPSTSSSSNLRGSSRSRLQGNWATRALALTIRLRDLLLTSSRQGWRLFSSRYASTIVSSPWPFTDLQHSAPPVTTTLEPDCLLAWRGLQDRPPASCVRQDQARHLMPCRAFSWMYF